MFYTKYPHPANFVFASAAQEDRLQIGGREARVLVQEFQGGVARVEVVSPELWPHDLNLIDLTPPAPSAGQGVVEVTSNAALNVKVGGKVVLSGAKLGCIGLSGQASLFAFGSPDDARYFGLGEKSLGRFEMSNVRTKYWNTDVCADFPGEQWWEHPTDPFYASVPYVLVYTQGAWVGLLLENLCTPFIQCGSGEMFFADESELIQSRLLIGAEDGKPILWVITGETCAEVTTKLQKLVGTVQRPPLWALGNHQSRWGYGGHEDLTTLDQKFDELGIPVDGLWLDIDYMDGYRVFTYADAMFPKSVGAAIEEVKRRNRRVVPIIDPGVKVDSKFPMFAEGEEAGNFCLNPAGTVFNGLVWPGLTAFPDFTKATARDWWAGYAKGFLNQGFGGAWIDMNDPATGAVDNTAMLFRDGKHPHHHFHNQYALGMAMATYQGFADARPNERPFLVTRSGCTGTSRYSAVWTGDNVSNRFYLKASVPMVLNMSLSSLPYAAPDVGGFLGDTNEDLMVDWVKAGFLFPFFRNHSNKDFREQEPWRFSKSLVDVYRRYVRLRYSLIPYLYNLFVRQEERGEPMLRPLFYEFETPELRASYLERQFMVGPSLLHAPFLDEARSQEVVLPAGAWFDLEKGGWIEGGRTAERRRENTPLFARDGSIVPTLIGERTDNAKELAHVEFHVFVNAAEAEYEYVYDDGLSLAYRQGQENRLRMRAHRNGGSVEITTISSGPLPEFAPRFVIYGGCERISVNGQALSLSESGRTWTGESLVVQEAG